jgi:Flp pilus assembly protein TadG
MEASWLRKQSGQAVVLVAVAVLALTAILALALDGGSIYLDKRQLQNAADAAALAGAERLMAVPPSNAITHNQAMANVIKNLPGTSLSGTVCNVSCPSLPTIGLPGMSGIGSINLGAGYFAEASITSSYTYQVTIWHSHPVVVAPIHGFQSTITLSARATAQNGNLPYAIVALQDKAAYANWHDVQISGSPGAIALSGGGSPGDDRGGIFSNASIDAGTGTPAITFSPSGNAGDLWAVNESGSDQGGLNTAGRVTGQQTAGSLPQAGVHLDFPTYPEPSAPSTSYGSTTVSSGTQVLCPGKYTSSITVSSGATAILLPGVYHVNGDVNVQGTLRTLTSADLPIIACSQTVASGADLGAIVEIQPDPGTSDCDLHKLSAASGSTITLTSSTKYFDISVYVEPLPSWQTVCSLNQLGSNVVRLSSGACYSISGAIFGPADNMQIGGSGCGTGVGQVVAWTVQINGTGTVNVSFDPTHQPYIKGLTQ